MVYAAILAPEILSAKTSELRLAPSLTHTKSTKKTPRRAFMFFAIFDIFVVASPSAAVETVAFPLAQDPDFYLFAFDCNEGKYRSMRSMLGGARLADR